MEQIETNEQSEARVANWTMYGWLGAALCGAALFFLLTHNPNAENTAGEIEGCVARGVKYFGDVGSYPTLSDGRKAQDVARERCSRTVTAFGS